MHSGKNGPEDLLTERKLEARSKICARVRTLLRLTEAQSQRLSPYFGPTVLSTLEQRSDHVRFTAENIGRIMLRQAGLPEEEIEVECKSPATILAMHRLISSSPEIFTIDEVSHKDTNAFSVRPADERMALTLGKQMVQASLKKGNASDASFISVQSFCSKAKKAIRLRKKADKSNQIMSISLPQMAGVSPFPESNWTVEDRYILTLLRASLGTFRRFQNDVFGPLVMYILKLCDFEVEKTHRDGNLDAGPSLDADTIQVRAVIQFLQDLGLFTPWEGLGVLDSEFHRYIQSTNDSTPVSQASVPSYDDSIRQDFTSNVYVIDDAAAEELDDGISVVPSSDPDQTWVHVHVADPTTHLQPGDKNAVAAQRKQSSIYLPEGNWPMLDRSVTRNTDLRGINGRNPLPAMRFSAKVNNRTGAVTDIDVGLSWIRNHRIITYDEASQYMTDEFTEKEEANELKLVHRIACALQERRKSIGGALPLFGTEATVKISPSPLPPSPIWTLPNALNETPLYEGFPMITMTYQEKGLSMDPHANSAKASVAEFMILAGRVSSSWSASRSIPIYYRGQHGFDEKGLEKLSKLNDRWNYSSVLSERIVFHSSILSTTPMEHGFLGISTRRALTASSQGYGDLLTNSGYTRSTSPLRRFPDLLSHWQIKASLRGDKKLPFSIEDLEESIPFVMRMERWHQSISKLSQRYWTAAYLYRALWIRQQQISGVKIPHEEELLEQNKDALRVVDGEHDAVVTISEIRLRSDMSESVHVLIEGLSLQAVCRWDQDQMGIPEAGSTLRVRISNVVLAGKLSSVNVEPV